MRLVKITSQSLGAKLTRDYMLARELAANHQTRAEYAAMVLARSPHKIMPFGIFERGELFVFKHVAKLFTVGQRVNSYVRAAQ